MKATLKDYAYWDDTYAFIEDQDPDYAGNNFTPDSLHNLRLSGVVITDAAASSLLSLIMDAEGEVVPMPDDLLSQLKPYLTPLNPTDTADSPSSFLQILNGQPFLIARSAINNTLASLPANGVMYFLRPAG